MSEILMFGMALLCGFWMRLGWLIFEVLFMEVK